jgi:hypothetical protein
VIRFLGEPEKTAPHPQRGGPPMKLYALARVREVEATGEFSLDRLDHGKSRNALETLLQRLNRKLAHQDERVREARVFDPGLGDYFLVDVSLNARSFRTRAT